MKVERKNDFRVKTRKDGLEQKRNFLRTRGQKKKEKRGQQLDSIRSLYEVLYPFQNQNLNSSFQNQNLNSSFQNFLPRILESITAGLDACQIAIFRD